jgi:hypothetical protein
VRIRQKLPHPAGKICRMAEITAYLIQTLRKFAGSTFPPPIWKKKVSQSLTDVGTRIAKERAGQNAL